MACTPTVQRSPGYLALVYSHVSHSVNHSTRARLLFGIDPMDTSLMNTTATDWAGNMRTLMTSAFTITGYKVLRADGSLLYDGYFTTPVVGTHGLASGAEDWLSQTVTFTGIGHAASSAACVGEELHRVFIGGALAMTPSRKELVSGVDSAYDLYAVDLNSNIVIWADYYGQKAITRGTFPLQFNAHEQKRGGT